MTAYLQSLFTFGTYKAKQGRLARQATFFGLVLLAASGAWALKSQLDGAEGYEQSGVVIALAVFALLCWAAYRLVQLPKFAEFLIDVEHEMKKVAWPSRDQLWKASIVVIVTIFFMAAVLFAYDFLWREIIGTLLGEDTLIRQGVAWLWQSIAGGGAE